MSLATILALVLVATASALAADANSNTSTRRPPHLTIQADRFLLDGKPIDLMGIRVSSGTWNQAQTDHLIAQLDDYKAHGVNAITVFYQGCAGKNYDPFSPDGKSVDPGHQARMNQIIEAAAQRNMIVIVGVFYQRAPITLRDSAAVREALRTVTRSLQPYSNIIINVCNEQNSPNWNKYAAVYDFTDPNNIIKLCRIVHEADPHRLVGGGGYDHPKNAQIGRSKDVDVLLFDTAGFERSGDLYRRFTNEGVTGKPMLNVETFGGITKRYPRGIFDPELKQHYYNEIDDGVAIPGLGVFFHNNPWCQSEDEPMRYDLAGQGTSDDPGIRWYFQYLQKRLHR